MPIYVIHMPLLALLHGFLVGPMAGLGGDGQALTVAEYPILLTAVVIGLSLAIHRGLLAVRATWLFEVPRRWRPAAPRRT